MDDLLRVLNESVLSDLECPVCMEYMVPPIELCTNGHNICSKCRESVQSCPTCRAKFTGIRNLALENIARKQKYPCANRQSGCLELFSIEHIAQHNDVCVYGKIKCPFQRSGHCSWKGIKSDFKEHAKAAHPQHLFQTSAVNFYVLGNATAILSCFDNLFTCYQKIHDDRLYCVAQLIGTSSEASKYKCEFTLRAANGIEQISKTFFVRGYTEESEAIFKSGRCLSIEVVTARNFLVENKLKFTVKLSRV
jgi:E3 ubiquitin-protein ligase SIAH1